MPSVVLRPNLWEVADVVEQIFFIAATCDLHPRPEEYDAATCDYAAEHGLSYSAMGLAMRQLVSEALAITCLGPSLTVF